MDQKLQSINQYIKSEKKIQLSLGEVIDLQQRGQGGNSIVYSGILHNKEVALKIFIADDPKKLLRFKAEYLNIISLNEYSKLLVKYINYEEFKFPSIGNVPIIVMNFYPRNLKKFKKSINVVNYKDYYKLLKFLKNSIEFIHKNHIIHRDIKPENILVDENNNFVLADFGIAKYDENFAIQPETKIGERMGNYQFSAPEQAKEGVKPSITMDIYALGQVCQWFATGETHRGTGRKKISACIEGKNIEILDRIIDKCIANNPEDRFQSISEIIDFYKNSITLNRSAFDYVEDFSDALRKSYPRGYNKITYITEKKYLEKLFHNLNEKSFGKKLWYNRGNGAHYITRLNYEPNCGHLTLNGLEAYLKGVWLYECISEYNDLIILDLEELPDFVIDNKKTKYMSIINDEYKVNSDDTNSGYIEFDSEIIEVISRDDISRKLLYRYYVLGTQFHCSLLSKNDDYIINIQNCELNQDIIKQLIDNIKRNIHPQISICL